MALLQLFKEQLENESRGIATSKGLVKRGDFLTWWYFQRLVGLPPDEIDEVVCDGYNDLGIDAIRIDDSNAVHFYTFKNPVNLADGFPSGAVDNMLSGLSLILRKQDDPRIANVALLGRVEELRQIIPSSYRIHLVTSGSGMSADAAAKLDGFIADLKPPSDDFWLWGLEDLQELQTKFYTKSLPTVDETFDLPLDQPPYQVRSANHDCYLFDMSGKALADLYEKHGEQLLQQNIRVSQGDRSTNALIRRTATGPDSGNFFHYNNGVVFLTETGRWDGFTRKLSLSRFQVVNGGQTIRVLHKAQKAKALRDDVVVAVRAITSQGDKDFGNNVTVNLNNQNRIEPSFLRSNDTRVVQLANALSSLGWYLERRQNEVATMAPTERAAIESRIQSSMDQRTIRLKEGMQAYVATFMRQPELAKKNPKMIFLGVQDGGMLDKVFAAELSAEKVIAAHRLASLVAEYVKQFMTVKRRKDRVPDWQADYATVLGGPLVNKHSAIIDQVVPQSAVFLCAIVFEEWVTLRRLPLEELLTVLESREYAILNDKIELLIDFQASPKTEAKAWPTLLKSQPLFENFASFLKGRVSGSAGT
jgi:hypothetical protein